MKLTKRVSESSWKATGFLVLILGVVFASLYVAGYYYLTHKKVDVPGANYPVETNVTGLVHVSMGPGSYSVRIEPRKITGLTVNVCCVGGPAGLYNCVNGSVLRVKLENCGPGGIVVVYRGTALPHALDLMGVEVSKTWR